MKKTLFASMALVGCVFVIQAASLTLESAPPVVVKTVPQAGATDVDPGLGHIEVTFSKKMKDQNWSWVQWDAKTFPQILGSARYSEDYRTCSLPVKLEPGKPYVIWINTEKFSNFKDTDGNSAVPYLLTFKTRGAGDSAQAADVQQTEPRDLKALTTSLAAIEVSSNTPSAEFLPGLNPSQRAVLAWTDRSFRSFFDGRQFEGWKAEDLKALEAKLIDALKGPHSQDYFLAINTLGAMRSTNALPALRAIAYERADRNNRDRWMAIRSLGLIGKPEDVPNLIHLVYHGNVNTHWWAQLALVKITGENFGSDWNAWADWWKRAGGEPAYSPEIIRWWEGQPEASKLPEFLADSDQKFLEKLVPKNSASNPER